MILLTCLVIDRVELISILAAELVYVSEANGIWG